MRHLKYVSRMITLALLTCACAAGAFGQETTGTINGTVKDTTGAVVAGATVTFTDEEKNVVVRTVTTGDEGNFSAPLLPVGLYTVTIEAAGFKKSAQTGVKLDVNSRRGVDVELEPGSLEEVVTVEADPVAVELTTPTAATTINGDQVRELSINNRNWVSLVTLAPGVSHDLEDLVFTGTNNPDTQVVNRTLISVNGARSTQNTFTVDGADITDRGSNLTIQAYPNVDSIGEFKVLRSLYPAESGRSGGGQVNVVTRSGGDEFHGSAFEFIRNEAFNANDFQTNRTAAAGRDSQGRARRRPFRYNNYGFTVGGPVMMPNFGEGNEGGLLRRVPRTFFFFAEEQRRDTRYPTISTRNTSGGGAAPTDAMEQGVFPVDICLRATSATTCADVLPAGTPLGSRVPVSNVAQQYVSRIWSKVPGPNDPATLSLDFPALNVAKFRQEILKIDHSFSERLTGFYRYQRDTIPTLDADGSIGTRSNLPFVNQMVSDSPGRTHTLQANYTVSPNVILEGRYAYGYGAIFTRTTGLLAKEVSPIAVNLPFESVRDVVPSVTIAGFSALTGFSNYDNFSYKRNFSGSLTWIEGSHTMKFGAMYSRYRKNENALSGTNQGAFSAFNNTAPGVTSASVRAPGVGNTPLNNLYQAFANFLQGNNVTFTQSRLDLEADLRQQNVEWFAQDEWRARQNLTVYFGLRHSYFGPAWDENGHLTNFVPGLWNPAQAPQVTGNGNRVAGTGNFCNGLVANAQNYETGPASFNCTPVVSPWGKYVYQASKRDFAPRVGLAWDPFGKGMTSIRTGWGVYHEQIPVGSIELQTNNPPYQQTVTVLNTTLDSPIPPGQTPTVAASLTPQTISRSIQSDLKTPYMQHWSLDLQHQLDARTIFTIGYYGSKGTHLTGFTEYNDLPPGLALTTQCATGTNTLQTPGAATVLCMTPGTAFTATPAILDQIRPYRGYRSINILESRYNSNYHGMQLYAQRRFGGASQVNLAYTWSKNLTDNQTSSVSHAPQDSNNIRAEYGRAVLDRRHVLNINYIYELPFFSDQRGFVGKLLGGWQASGIISYQTGVPFTVSYATYDPAGIGYIPAAIAGGRPSLLCDPNEGAARTVDQWFNTACFTAQTPAGATGVVNVPGNAPRGVVDGPPTEKVDFTLTKNIRFSESVSVQLRAEAFNVFNHTNFRNLSTSRALTNTQFGQVISFRDPRIMQFGAKFYF